MRSTLVAIAMAVLCSVSVCAQPVLTPRNVALGGGGSTYITDYHANFYNPANLLIRDRERSTDIGVFVIGSYFNAVQNYSDINQQRGNLEDYIFAYEPGAYNITATDRSEIVQENFPRQRETSFHQTRLDVTLLGIKWRKENKAYSFVLRNRISSSFEIGRGWYSVNPVDTDDGLLLDRTLNHQYQSLYEISFGYAESFRFFSDMTSRLDELSFGIAPKFVIAGPFQDANWQHDFIESNSGDILMTNHLEYAATGSISNATSAYLGGTSAQQAVTENVTDSFFSLNGYGGGIDIGFTYYLTFGSDFSTISDTENRTQKSLRFSLSITDLGVVAYPGNNVSLSTSADTSTVGGYPNREASEVFVGAPGQFIDFVDEFGTTNPITSASREEGPVLVMLPTAMHGGILFEINRVKLMGDVSLGLTNNAFNNKKLVTSVGIELRPLKFLPIRAGARFADELPSFLSFGAAIETKRWDFSIAAQFASRTFSTNPTISGVTVGALQFHF